MGACGHRVDAGLRLGEGDDLADVLLAGEDRHEAVDAEGEAAVRRGAVAERRRGRTRSAAGPPPRRCRAGRRSAAAGRARGSGSMPEPSSQPLSTRS